MSNLVDGSTLDQLSIRLVDNTDKGKLTAIATALGAKFDATPTEMAFKKGDPNFISDTGIGLNLELPVMPRTGVGPLPISPFVETFAPYVSRLRLVFFITGPYTYLGRQEPYEDADVSVEVKMPDFSADQVPSSLAFYGVDVIIKNHALQSFTLPLPAGSVPSPGRPMGRPQRFPLVALLAIAGLVSAAFGIFLSMYLPRWKAAAAVGGNTPTVIEDHHE